MLIEEVIGFGDIVYGKGEMVLYVILRFYFREWR